MLLGIQSPRTTVAAKWIGKVTCGECGELVGSVGDDEERVAQHHERVLRLRPREREYHYWSF